MIGKDFQTLSLDISFAMKDPKVVGITGDGSFQTNIQELQTIVHYGLPIKLFLSKIIPVGNILNPPTLESSVLKNSPSSL